MWPLREDKDRYQHKLNHLSQEQPCLSSLNNHLNIMPYPLDIPNTCGGASKGSPYTHTGCPHKGGYVQTHGLQLLLHIPTCSKPSVLCPGQL